MQRPPDPALGLKALQTAFGRSVRSATANPADLQLLAIHGRSGDAEDGALVNPRMTGNDAVGFTGTEEDSWKRIGRIEVRSHFCKQVSRAVVATRARKIDGRGVVSNSGFMFSRG